MRIRVRDASNVLRTLTRIRARDASNVLRTITRIRVRDASNVLRTVYSAGGGGGGGSPTAQLFAMVADDLNADPLNATASIEFTASGDVNIVGNGSSPADYSWLTGGSAADCEIRVNVTSGTFSSGPAVGTWHSLSTTRKWILSQTVIGTKSVDATVQIRNASTLASLAGPVQFDFSVDVVP